MSNPTFDYQLHKINNLYIFLLRIPYINRYFYLPSLHIHINNNHGNTSKPTPCRTQYYKLQQKLNFNEQPATTSRY